MNDNNSQAAGRVFVAGATGYIGRHVVKELVKRGYEVVSFAREQAGIHGKSSPEQTRQQLTGSEVRFGNILSRESLIEHGFREEKFDAVISCLASRTGGIDDANRVEYEANLSLLEAAQQYGVKHFVLLSAICVQKPRLAFQFAKLKFEQALIASGINYSIVRPTAFFKSLAGQVEAVKRGKPFIVFGDGTLTACKPISESDLAIFIADCLVDESKQQRILPVGGPGPAITPRQQGLLLFDLCQRKARFRHVPVQLFSVVIAVLTPVSWLIPGIRDKIEFARIGRYYATESMLVLDPQTNRYEEAATPSYGAQTLKDFYKQVLRDGIAGQEAGDHAMFS